MSRMQFPLGMFSQFTQTHSHETKTKVTHWNKYVNGGLPKMLGRTGEETPSGETELKRPLQKNDS